MYSGGYVDNSLLNTQEKVVTKINMDNIFYEPTFLSM